MSNAAIVCKSQFQKEYRSEKPLHFPIDPKSLPKKGMTSTAQNERLEPSDKRPGAMTKS